MQRVLHRHLLRRLLLPQSATTTPKPFRLLSTSIPPDDPLADPSWSLGLSPGAFSGPAVGRPAERRPHEDDAEVSWEEELQKGKQGDRVFVDGWEERYEETCALMKQVLEPGARGSYLKDSEKAEMYRLHRQDPQLYSVDRLAKDFRIMRQRVHAVLWLKELEEQQEKRTGGKLDDSIEKLLDQCPEWLVRYTITNTVGGGLQKDGISPSRSLGCKINVEVGMPSELLACQMDPVERSMK